MAPHRIFAPVLLALAASPTLAANLAVNGDFETPAIANGTFTTYLAGQDLAGWTVESSGVDLARAPFWNAASRLQSIDLNGGGLGGVRQTIATQVGRNYEITYAIAGNFQCGSAIKTVGLSWAGAQVGSSSFDSTGATVSNMRWRHVPATVVTATSASTELALRALAPAGGCGPTLDKVEAVPRVTPYRKVRLLSRAFNASATGNGESVLDTERAATADGRFVAFAGNAQNLAANDGDTEYDVFVADLSSGQVSIVSRTPQGGTPNGSSYTPTFTPDGRFLLFASGATNLATTGPVPGNFQSFYLQDRQNGSIRLVSVNASGTGGSFVRTGAMDISDDGRYIPMSSEAPDLVSPGVSNGKIQVYLRDMTTASTTLVTRNLAGTNGGNGNTVQQRMSRDGRYLAFASESTDLVSAADANNAADVFLWDRITNAVVLVSHTASGVATAAGSSTLEGISDDGARVVFLSTAADLVPGDTNAAQDVFVYETATGLVRRASCNAACVTAGNGASDDALLSGNGGFVAFTSVASDLVAGDGNLVRDLFVRNLATGVVQLLTPGATAPGSIDARAISADGRLVLSQSDSVLTEDDANGSVNDLYLHDRVSGRTALVSRGEFGSTPGADAAFLAGSRIFFQSDAANMTVESDSNAAADVFVVELADLFTLFRDGFE